jgi:hypothetical protein
VQHAPEQRQEGDGHAEIARAQEEERVGRVAEREECQDDEIRAKRAGQALRQSSVRRWRALRRHFAHRENEQDGERPGNERSPEHRPHRPSGGEKPRREERAEHGARVIHRLMKPERTPGLPLARRGGDESVARSRADPLSDPIRHPHDEDVPGRRRERDERTRDRRQQIARENERPLAPRAVCDVSERELEKARRSIRGALDEPQEDRRCPERRQKNGEQRENHLRADVREQTRESERDDGGGETWSRRTLGGRGRQARPLSCARRHS